MTIPKWHRLHFAPVGAKFHAPRLPVGKRCCSSVWFDTGRLNSTCFPFSFALQLTHHCLPHPFQTSEYVHGIRSALLDHADSATFTSYRLVLMNAIVPPPLEPEEEAVAAAARAAVAEAGRRGGGGGGGVEEGGGGDIDSSGAAVLLSLPPVVVVNESDGTCEMNDALELGEYCMAAGLVTGATIRMVRFPYDARGARNHLRRLHDLLL